MILRTRPSVHLFRWTDVVQDLYSGTKPDCSPCCRPGRVLLQVLTDFRPKSPIRSSVHWISTGQHQDRAYADTILGGLSAPMRSNLLALTASSRRPETGFGEMSQLDASGARERRSRSPPSRLALRLLARGAANPSQPYNFRVACYPGARQSRNISRDGTEIGAE